MAYNLPYTNQQIEDAIGRALEGGAIDERIDAIDESEQAIDGRVSNLETSKEDNANKVAAITDENKTSETLYPSNAAVVDYVEKNSGKMEKYRIDYDGTNFTHDGTILTYKDIHDALLINPDFVYIVYGDRSHLPSFINDDGTIKEIRFSSTIISGLQTKTQSFYITSTDGETIANVQIVNINNENASNKVGAIGEGSDVYYPTTNAVKNLVEAKVAEGFEKIIDYTATEPVAALDVNQFADGTPLKCSEIQMKIFATADPTQSSNQSYVLWGHREERPNGRQKLIGGTLALSRNNSSICYSVHCQIPKTGAINFEVSSNGVGALYNIATNPYTSGTNFGDTYDYSRNYDGYLVRIAIDAISGRYILQPNNRVVIYGKRAI